MDRIDFLYQIYVEYQHELEKQVNYQRDLFKYYNGKNNPCPDDPRNKEKIKRYRLMLHSVMMTYEKNDFKLR